MDDDDLEQLLRDGFLPFARAFADHAPGRVTLQVTLTDRSVRGTLAYAASDFSLVTAGSFPKTQIGQAFRALVDWHDGRRPSLSIVSA